jgi:hypothetical protein
MAGYITLLTLPEDLMQKGRWSMQDLAGAFQFPRVEQLKMMLAILLRTSVYRAFRDHYLVNHDRFGMPFKTEDREAVVMEASIMLGFSDNRWVEQMASKYGPGEGWSEYAHTLNFVLGTVPNVSAAWNRSMNFGLAAHERVRCIMPTTLEIKCMLSYHIWAAIFVDPDNDIFRDALGLPRDAFYFEGDFFLQERNAQQALLLSRNSSCGFDSSNLHTFGPRPSRPKVVNEAVVPEVENVDVERGNPDVERSCFEEDEEQVAKRSCLPFGSCVIM